MLQRLLLASVSLCTMVAVAQAAPITTFTESLSTPQAPAGSTLTPISLTGITTPSTTTFAGAGYSISFNVNPGNGVVQGNLANVHAIPVAGGSMSAPTYLTDGYNSAQTTSAAASGNYLSTGATSGSQGITITFTTPQTSLALLWGSIDASNVVTLSNGDTLTGAQLETISGFAGNGSQGFDGSAYVTLTDSPFTSVTLTSGVASFESAGIVASTTPFGVPEPMSLAVFGASLAGLAGARRLFKA